MPFFALLGVFMLEKLIDYCEKNNIKYERGRNLCYCVDYNEFVNAYINGKWHTLYALDNGGYRYDSVIGGILNGEKPV